MKTVRHFTSIAASLILCVACLAWSQNSSAENDPTAGNFEDFVCDGNFFTAKVPKGWPKSESITSGRQAREYGVDLKGPKGGEGAYARISLTHYGADHRYFTTMDKYLLLNSRPDMSMPLKGEEYGPVRDVLVAGRKGKMFERKTFVFIPPYAVEPKKVAVFEKKVVLPGEKGGFYVLTYHAPDDIAKDNLKVFEKILIYFKPGK